jgi:hypothetical protein
MFTHRTSEHTLLSQSLLLVRLQTLVSILPLHGSIRPRLCKVQVHLLPEKVEALKLVDRSLRTVHIVVDDEGLSLALEAFLRYNLDNGAKLVEELVERFDQGGDLDVLVEVAGLLCFMLEDQGEGNRMHCPKRTYTLYPWLAYDLDLALVRTVCNVRTLRWVRSRRCPPWFCACCLPVFVVVFLYYVSRDVCE